MTATPRAYPDGPVAILGATGYTGGLVLECARDAGVDVRLVGRRRDALEAQAREGEGVRAADARDEAALRRAFDGAFAVVSCAGPFLELGPAPVAAAIAVGAHYLDTCAEQLVTRAVYERFGTPARERGVTALPSFGFDYAVGDVAARVAAEGLEPLDEVVVGYATSRFATSSGTRATLGHLLAQPLVAWEDGALVPSGFGATKRRFRFPDGDASAVEWHGTEPLTVPRHTDVRRVRSFLRVPRGAAPFARFLPPLAPAAKLAGRVGGGPSMRRRRRATFAVVAEARGPRGGRRATLTGSDPYGLTALLLVRGTELLRRGEGRTAGAAAPAEAFDVHVLLERLAPLLHSQNTEPL